MQSELALSATTSKTSRHRRCCSRANAGRSRSRTPITSAIAYSQVGLRPLVLFFFFRRDTLALCIFICSSRWCQNNTLLHGYDHVHLDLSYKGLSSACGTHRFLLQSQHSCHYDASTVGGVSSSNFTFDLFSSLTVYGAPTVTAGGMLEYIWYAIYSV
jgi:hypothetical protein